MKRSLPADFDPVYPFGKNPPPSQTPYINPQRGFVQDPPGELALKVHAPLTFASDGALAVEPVFLALTGDQSAQGQKTFTGRVTVPPVQSNDPPKKVASKQYVDNRILELRPTVDTLWTGLPPTSTSSNFLELWVYISLTRVDNIVCGQYGFKGMTGRWVNLSSSFSIYLNYNNGQLATQFKSPFGPKVGNTVDASIPYNFKKFMPNLTIYKRNVPQSTEIRAIHLSSSTNAHGTMYPTLVTYNGQSAQTSIELRVYVNPPPPANLRLTTNLVSFYFYPEEI